MRLVPAALAALVLAVGPWSAGPVRAAVGPDPTAGVAAPISPTVAGGPPVGAAAVGAAAVGAATPPPGAAVPRGRWVWPLDPRPVVLEGFHPPDVRWAAGHRGVDLAAVVGQPVRAPADGTVAFRGVVVDRGVLVVATDGGLRTTLEPVTSTLDVGARVRRGEVVGAVTGEPGHCAPSTCLHWGVLRRDVSGDAYLDPLALVGSARVVLLPLTPSGR